MFDALDISPSHYMYLHHVHLHFFAVFQTFPVLRALHNHLDYELQCFSIQILVHSMVILANRM